MNKRFPHCGKSALTAVLACV
jgi:DNA-binding IclR family transcriptional regulator